MSKLMHMEINTHKRIIDLQKHIKKFKLDWYLETDPCTYWDFKNWQCDARWKNICGSTTDHRETTELYKILIYKEN